MSVPPPPLESSSEGDVSPPQPLLVDDTTTTETHPPPSQLGQTQQAQDTASEDTPPPLTTGAAPVHEDSEAQEELLQKIEVEPTNDFAADTQISAPQDHELRDVNVDADPNINKEVELEPVENMDDSSKVKFYDQSLSDPKKSASLFAISHEQRSALKVDGWYPGELDVEPTKMYKSSYWILIALALVGFLFLLGMYIPFLIILANPGRLKGNAWAYNYNGISPPYWANLSDEYWACRDGQEQSPINIYTTEIEYPESDINIIDNILSGSNSANFDQYFDDKNPYMICTENCNHLNWKGMTYTLDKIIFHGPSEHQLDSYRYALEIQLIYRNGTGTAALGIFYKQDTDVNNTLLNTVWFANMNISVGSSRNVPDFQVDALYDLRSNFYQYMGSDTIPPCTQNVTWFLQKTTMSISGDQQQYLFDLVGYPGNSRNLQPTNNRTVSLYS